RRREGVRRGGARPVRLGVCGHGDRRCRARDRTARAVMVHSGIQTELVAARVADAVDVGVAGQLPYSGLRALIGDSPAARAAGIMAAQNAQIASEPAPIDSASGSQNLMP